MSELKTNYTSEASAVAALSAKPIIETIAGVPTLLLPEGWTAQQYEKLLPLPLRKSGTIKVHTVESFIDVVKKHGSLASCNIYLDVDYSAPRFKAVAIFNDHGEEPTAAAWRDHRAEFDIKFTEEWNRWKALDNKPQNQEQFAHFLEANIADIAGGEKLPTGSDVLTFVSRLEETRTVKYGSKVNIQNGLVQLEFTEDNDTATKGKLEVFHQFAIGIRPFFNGTPYQIKAFLRYRIDRNTGAIAFWYELQRPDKVIEDATADVVKQIVDTSGIPVIFGTP